MWIGEQTKGLETLPIPVIAAAAATLITFLTELTSDMATTAVPLPIMNGVVIRIGVATENPMNVPSLIVPTALTVTLAFMLPVAIPPNAATYGSGYIRIEGMAKMDL